MKQKSQDDRINTYKMNIVLKVVNNNGIQSKKASVSPIPSIRRADDAKY